MVDGAGYIYNLAVGANCRCICIGKGQLETHTHSNGDQGRKQGLGPTMSSLAAVEVLDFSMISYGYTLSPQTCTLQWRLVMWFRLGVYRCSA